MVIKGFWAWVFLITMLITFLLSVCNKSQVISKLMAIPRPLSRDIGLYACTTLKTKCMSIWQSSWTLDTVNRCWFQSSFSFPGGNNPVRTTRKLFLDSSIYLKPTFTKYPIFFCTFLSCGSSLSRLPNLSAFLISDLLQNYIVCFSPKCITTSQRPIEKEIVFRKLTWH